MTTRHSMPFGHVLHPLQDEDRILFYGAAEDVIAKVPKRGIPMIPAETETGDKTKTKGRRSKPTKLYSASGTAKLVCRLRKEAKLPSTVTLDACWHGGMTELEEAELTDGQGRALSAHRPIRAGLTKVVPNAISNMR